MDLFCYILSLLVIDSCVFKIYFFGAWRLNNLPSAWEHLSGPVLSLSFTSK